MQKVLVIAGAKQSGKSTSAKFIHGHLMKQAGVITNYRIDEDDDLLITLPTGQECILDIHRNDPEFVEFAAFNVWPYAKVYSFAEELKESAMRIFSLDPQCLYGSDEDKNQPTHIKWKDIVNLVSVERFQQIQHKLDEFLTHRELLQEFGTICRIFYPDCWIQATWSKIRAEGFPLAIIDDGRYENEVDFSNQEEGVYVVRLTKRPFKNDNHTSELIHTVPANKFFAEIDNENLTIDEKNNEIKLLLEKIL
jgi:energy-coupling factor transporter ATP-binding protein EcfA2